MATHSSTLAWEISWTQEPGRLQSMGSQRVGHTKLPDKHAFFSPLLLSQQVVSDSTTPQTAARQASLSLTISLSVPKFVFIASVMPSSHLIF